jgi:hypothetical protein
MSVAASLILVATQPSAIYIAPSSSALSGKDKMSQSDSVCLGAHLALPSEISHATGDGR